MTKTVYLTGNCELSRDENTILVRTDGTKRRIPVQGVSHIVAMTDGTLTTKFLSLCGKNAIRVSFFDHYGWFTGAFEPVNPITSGVVHIKQAEHATSPAGIRFAQELLSASTHNKVSNLKYHLYRGNTKLETAIKSIGKYAAKIAECNDAESLMGIEGIIQRTYFESWSIVDERLSFGKRVRRPPNNQINCLISFLNSLTYAAVRHEISKTHLNECISFLHAPFNARSSLSLDISEPFKPMLSDLTIWTAIRKNQIKENWFHTPTEGVCLLTREGRKSVIDLFTRAADGIDGFKSEIRRTCLSLERSILSGDEFKTFRRKI